MFHYRHITADAENSFCDIVDGKPYMFQNGTVEHTGVDALVCGDWHVGSTCPIVRSKTYDEIVPMLKPKRIFKHDFFDGRSVSHHDEKDKILMAQKAQQGQLCLKSELELCSDELKYIKENANGAEIYMVASNHNDHLCKYIREERYTEHHHNKQVCIRLADKMISEHLPAFQLAMTDKGHIDVNFMLRDEEFVLHGWKLDLHGDVGCNGAKGSANSFDKVGLRAIIGHGHSPCIKRGVLMVGTSTYLKLGYTKGLTGWLNTHAIVYPNGQAQLINIIGGKWYGSSNGYFEG